MGRLGVATLLLLALVLVPATAADGDMRLTINDQPLTGTVRVDPGEDLTFQFSSTSWPWATGNSWTIDVSVSFGGAGFLERSRTVTVPITNGQPIDFTIPITVPDFTTYSNGPFRVVANLRGLPTESATFSFDIRPVETELLTVENAVIAAFSVGWLLWLRRIVRVVAVLAGGVDKLEPGSKQDKGRLKAAFAEVRRRKVRVLRHSVGLGLVGGLLAGQVLRSADVQGFTGQELLMDALAGILGAVTLVAFATGLLRRPTHLDAASDADAPEASPQPTTEDAASEP